MSKLFIADNLFRELLWFSLFLLIIMLYNTLVLYRRKITDRLSLMMLATVAMCAFELMWEYFDGNPGLSGLLYIAGCGYVLSFIAFGAFLNWFFMDRFELMPNKPWLRGLLYGVPITIFALLCVSTPWTRLLFWVDEQGILQEMVLFGSLFYIVLLGYLLGALIPALYYIFFGHNKDKTTKQLGINLIIFGVIGPIVYLLEMLVIGDPDSDYYVLSPAVSLALVYLSSNVNTHMLLETQAKVEAVESDLRIAAKIQTDALPPVAPEFADHLEVSLRASMNTAKEVGGDFYDYFTIDDHRICFLIADVSGKGTPAALFMMTAKTMIKDYALIHGDTAEIFTAVNQRLCENNDAGMFATAWIGILDTNTMSLQFTNAGHNYPMFKRLGEACALLKKKHGLFLAGMEDTVYGQSEMQLQAGDRLLLYTDGVTEAHNPGGQLYGDDRLMEVINNTADDKGETMLSRVLSDVNQFADSEPQFDDITLIVLTIKK